jgi:hypothetical protein
MSNPVENLHTPERQTTPSEGGALNFLELQERMSPQARGGASEHPIANFDQSNNQLIRDGLIPALQLTGLANQESLAQWFPPTNPGQGSPDNGYFPANPGQNYPPENQGPAPYQVNPQEAATVGAVLGAVMQGLLGGDQSPPPQDPSAQPDAPAPPAILGLNPLESQSLLLVQHSFCKFTPKK